MPKSAHPAIDPANTTANKPDVSHRATTLIETPASQKSS
jgi:hypothetical protein